MLPHGGQNGAEWLPWRPVRDHGYGAVIVSIKIFFSLDVKILTRSMCSAMIPAKFEQGESKAVEWNQRQAVCEVEGETERHSSPLYVLIRS